MTWRNVMVYWAAAGIIGALLAAGARRDAATPPPPPDIAPLVSISPSRFERVTVERGGASARFERQSDRWVTVAPEGFRVTSDLVAALLDTLASIPPVERLSMNGRSSGQFGLSPPEAVISMVGPGDATASVDIGKRNPTGTAVYAARAGEDSVYLLGLNAQYYVELIFDELGRQRRDAPSVE